MEFLTDEQADAYGRFTEEPTRPELERFFFLGDSAASTIMLIGRTGDISALGDYQHAFIVSAVAAGLALVVEIATLVHHRRFSKASI